MDSHCSTSLRIWTEVLDPKNKSFKQRKGIHTFRSVQDYMRLFNIRAHLRGWVPKAWGSPILVFPIVSFILACFVTRQICHHLRKYLINCSKSCAQSFITINLPLCVFQACSCYTYMYSNKSLCFLWSESGWKILLDLDILSPATVALLMGFNSYVSTSQHPPYWSEGKRSNRTRHSFPWASYIMWEVIWHIMWHSHSLSGSAP